MSQTREDGMLYRKDIVEATISLVDEKSIHVIIGRETYSIPALDVHSLHQSFKEQLIPGNKIPVYVISPADAGGMPVLSISRAAIAYYWKKAREFKENRELITVTIRAANKNGLLVNWHILSGLIPYNYLVSIPRSLAQKPAVYGLVGTSLEVKIVKVDEERSRLLLNEQPQTTNKEAKLRIMDTLNVGDILTGTVTGIKKYGAFVHVNGADGLIHISEIAWNRVNRTDEVLRLGDIVQVVVLGLDKDHHRIALSRKRALPDPWADASTRYEVGQQCVGVVHHIVDYGIFVLLEDGIEGLLHKTEMGNWDFETAPDGFEIGEKIDVVIIVFSPEERRMGFSLVPDPNTETVLNSLQIDSATKWIKNNPTHPRTRSLVMQLLSHHDVAEPDDLEMLWECIHGWLESQSNFARWLEVWKAFYEFTEAKVPTCLDDTIRQALGRLLHQQAAHQIDPTLWLLIGQHIALLNLEEQQEFALLGVRWLSPKKAYQRTDWTTVLLFLSALPANIISDELQGLLPSIDKWLEAYKSDVLYPAISELKFKLLGSPPTS